jgi:plasmid stability protein
MARMIQIRNVPDRLHRELVRRARDAGQTLTRYIEDVLRRELSRPSHDAAFQAIASREPVDLGMPAAEIIREEREKRRSR